MARGIMESLENKSAEIKQKMWYWKIYDILDEIIKNSANAF